MLRITQLETAAGIVLRVEGRLAGVWVDELRHAQDRHRAGALDLHGLQMADGDGVLLLRQFVVEGVELQHPSGYLAALLDESP